MAKPAVESEEERIVRRPIVKFTHKIEASQEDDDGEEDNLTPKKKTPKPEFEEFEMGGKRYKVEKGMGDALKAALKPKKPQDNTSEIKRMMDEYTAKLTKGKKKAADTEEGEDDEEFDDARLFTDPKGFFADLKKTLSKEIVQQISGMYNQDQNWKSFWNNFYGSNSDLKDYDFIVKAVLETNKAELAEMSVNEAVSKLGDLTRDQLMMIAKKVSKGNSKDSKKKFHVEGESSSRNNEPDDDDEDDDERDRKAGVPMTMSAMLKMRREKRQRPLVRNQDEE